MRDVDTPSAPAADAGARDVGHRGQVVGGGDAGPGAPAHHVGAHCGVRHVGADVDHARPLRQRVEILGERLPPPVDAFPQRGAGYVLDPLHELDQLLLTSGVHRREPDATVADDHGGDAVPARRRELAVPCGLTVVVGVHVDEAGGHEQTVGVDGLARRTADPSDLDDASVVDCDVAGVQLGTGAVDDRARAEYQIVHAVPSDWKLAHPNRARRRRARGRGIAPRDTVRR